MAAKTFQSDLEKTISEQLFSGLTTKGRLTRLKILRAAIELYGSMGMEAVTYEALAKKARLTRRLVQLYFPDTKELFLFSMRLVRAEFQELAVSSLAGSSNPLEQFKFYATAVLGWHSKRPHHANGWALFFYYCAIDSRFREVNSELVEMGTRRIAYLLGEISQIRSLSGARLNRRAKRIQTILTGALLTLATEALEKGQRSAYIEDTKKLVLSVALHG